MSLETLIPAEFFVAPAVAATAANGTISLHASGRVLVAWPRNVSSATFNANLTAARTLKTAIGGTFDGNVGGWLFPQQHAARIIAAFPGFVVAPAVAALTQQPQQPTTPAVQQPAAPAKHGRITLDRVSGQFFVEWGNCPSDAFQAYLAAARAIKQAYPHSRGYQQSRKGWLLHRAAGPRIVAAYPANLFDYPAELQGVQPQQPAAPAPVKQAPAQPVETVPPAAETAALLVVAEMVMSDPLPCGKVPMTHQREGVRWLLSAGERGLAGGILADEMGLGKTMTALLAAKVQARHHKARVLVVAPKALQENWRREARDCGVPITVTTNSAKGIPDAAEQSAPFVLIVDEAHAFQTLDTQRTKAFLALAASPNCRGIHLLTGTPIKNGRPVNLLPLLLAVRHAITRDQVAYKFRYCGPQKVWTGRKHVTTFNGATNLPELHEETRDAILRRKATDCLDLPALTRTLRGVELDTDAQATYNATVAALRAEYTRRLRAGEIKSGAEKLVTLSHLRKAGSLAKVETAIEMAEEVIEEGGQVVLFFMFTESARKVAEHFKTTAYTGETNPGKRTELVDDFQAGRSNVFVGNIQAGGVGLTLHANGKARVVILVDRPWTPGDALQAEKRIHRIGQPNACSAFWLQQGECDTVIDRLLCEKMANAEEVLAGTRESIEFQSAAELAAQVLDDLGWN